LKRQVAGAGHELVKGYIDDGYSGGYLDRPALESATPRTLPFRIEGEIAKGSKRRWTQDERFGSWVPGAILSSSI
jgi:hypothetical protein